MTKKSNRETINQSQTNAILFKSKPRQKRVHLKNHTLNKIKSQPNAVNNRDLNIGKMAHLFYKVIAQHRKGSPCGQDSIMYMHLKDKNQSIKDSDVKILDREDRWFERRVKEAIFVKLEQPSLRQGLSATYNAVLSSLAQQFRPNSHSDCNSHHLGGDSHSESNLTTVCDPVKCQGISSNWWIHLYEWRNILNIQYRRMCPSRCARIHFGRHYKYMCLSLSWNSLFNSVSQHVGSELQENFSYLVWSNGERMIEFRTDRKKTWWEGWILQLCIW